MKNSKKKGQYGYREYHKKIEFAKVLFGAVMILLQLFARNFTDNTTIKNALTVMAILSVLPTANVASPLVAAWKYRTPDAAFFSQVSPFENRFLILYDLIVTYREAIMPLDAVIVHTTGIYAYCTAGKLDTAKAEAFLAEMFTGHHLKPECRIILEEKAFFQTLNTLKPDFNQKAEKGTADVAREERETKNKNASKRAALLKSLSI